ncbi:hypothetical protein FJY84_05215, partial [Candidatus Bathyarchaeota archaeon]|nr:hypothetical protein [Candidatus Bathyarchaeota archaeon]
MRVLKTLILIIITFSIFSTYPDFLVNASLQVVLVEPPVNVEGVPINPTIIAFFPTPLLEETVIVENIKINNGEIPINVQIHLSLTAIQIIPLTPLSPATKYTVSLKEEISDIMGNKLTGGYNWSFIIAGPTIDQILVSDTRCDIGASVNISVHFNWGNGTDITSGTVFIKDTEAQINQQGWANYTIKNIIFGKNNYNITGIDCNGIK